ncbi:ARMT1-like domain-containing protein [Streptomyces lancefieldiae]|uniref:ARMT1-like domain-containing protein n=1 Tax=Streptomyces lancefieldiae TaxID=3075520 RepID=A0ABU3ANM5_9ACTN|nr:ARMT1-like domain-containing protein [Streptomyces sp. DSM 40712]MDT0611568.1 ARMT1-like domain-containing protein [Streptomyces sp. DSM 40712]
MPDTPSAPAPVILGNEPGSFPHGVLAERHPAIIRQVREAFPYDPERQRALDALLANCTEGVIEPLPADAHDRERWTAWGMDAYVGRSWFDVPWLWAESHFYRRLLDAVGHFGPGAWQGVDPFRPAKLAELDAPETDEELAALDGLGDLPADEQTRALLHGSLWGNRADLGFRLSTSGTGTGTGPGAGDETRALVADDSDALWSLLAPSGTDTSGTDTSGATPSGAAASGTTLSGATPSGATPPGATASRATAPTSAPTGPGVTASGPGVTASPGPGVTASGPGVTASPGPGGTATGPRTLCLVADNAGRELVPDLLLVSHLLAQGRVDRAVLHVKPYPYYVSDATTADVLDALRRLVAAGGAAAAYGRRLWAALTDGRVTVRAHPFSCAPLPYADMPADLREEFAAATVTVLKGDLNYRRLVGDRWWPPTTSFADVTAYFPGPVAALRTLKSDVITGLSPDTEAALEASGEQRWRTSGTHALIQVRR